MSQAESVKELLSILRTKPEALSYAQNIATAIVDGPDNHCAATLSALLVFVSIYPNGTNRSTGNLEIRALSLAFDLEKRRAWTRITVGSEIRAGDVGVIALDSGVHHIYIVVDAADQAIPIIADNQSPSLHPRAIAGDASHHWSPTSYFLRAPLA